MATLKEQNQELKNKNQKLQIELELANRKNELLKKQKPENNEALDYAEWVAQNGKFLQKFIQQSLSAKANFYLPRNEYDNVLIDDFDFNVNIPQISASEIKEQKLVDEAKNYAEETSFLHKELPLNFFINSNDVVFYSKHRYVSNNGYLVENMKLIKKINDTEVVFDFSFKNVKGDLVLLNMNYDNILTDDEEQLKEFNKVYKFVDFVEKYKNS